MRIALGSVAIVVGAGAAATIPAASQSDGRTAALDTAARLDAAQLTGLKWRPIGPAVSAGRTADLAVFEKSPKIIYAATATGGVWKTSNGGISWGAVFEHGHTASVGAVAVAADTPDVVWVGSGEAWSMRSNSWGDGVYRSLDGGKTWQHMGLEKTQHVGRILIDPRDHNVVYVAGMGALWTSNEERGLFKTTDGGKTWTKSLYVSPYTGVADIAMDAGAPDVLYAAAFQRERRNYSFLSVGPEGGLFKSTDAGKTWARLRGGLPSGEVGRVGVSACRSQPNIIYAAIRARDGGFYRSEDRGATWQRMTPDVQTHSGYGQVRCDPNDPNLVYVLDNTSHVTRDGGKTFQDDMTPRGQIHGDNHALWIDPGDSTHLVLGTDGGIYFSYDRGRTWDFVDNVPASQFFGIAVDMREPFYNVYGGLQDNGSWGGPSGTRNTDGITNADWFVTGGADGQQAAADPSDPNVVYSESEYGRLVRLNLATGEHRLIQPPQPLKGELYRWNWTAPILLSPHDHNTLYFAANVLFQSPDRGDSWAVISPDLTRKLDPSLLPLQGKIQPNTVLDLGQSTGKYSNISTLSESPLKRGLLAVGTDDGLVQVTADGGKSWTKIDTFPGVPERTYVTRVVLSRFDERTLYATFSGHQDNNFAPYVLKSPDLGRTWTSIAGDLPAAAFSVRVVTEDLRNPNLLFIGTESGVFASNNGGAHWISLGNNLPTVPVHDIIVHPREHDLVIGTHGRGVWILDDISILEELTPAVLSGGAHLAAIRPATELHRFARNRTSLGSGTFRAPNPPDGAIVTYYVGPGADGDRASVEVLDEGGNVIRRLAPSVQRGGGVQRLVWDLRHELPFEPDLDPTERQTISSGFQDRTQKGPFVLPGSYRVRLKMGETEQVQAVQVKGDPLSQISTDDRRTWRDTLLDVARLQVAARAALATTAQIREQLAAAEDALGQRSGSPKKLLEETRAIRAEAARISAALREPTKRAVIDRSAEQPGRSPILEELTRIYGDIEAWIGAPTSEQRQLIREDQDRLTQETAALNRLIAERLSPLTAALEKSRKKK